MKKSFINGVGCISVQKTVDAAFLAEVELTTKESVVFAKQPSYVEVISPSFIRRMAKGVKMGIFTSTQALKEANLAMPDAIITGTGLGCLEDSEKFLKAILDNNEQFLTPTSFIQSTHNTVAGQIALGLQCKGYNFTYVNGAVSLETALLDAKLQIETEEAHSVLVGGIDETAQHNIDVQRMAGNIKKQEDLPCSILEPTTKGMILGEGASFFVLEEQQKESSYATLDAISIQNSLELNEVEQYVKTFLNNNKISLNDIDLVVLGNNGDVEFDVYFNQVSHFFNQTPQAYFKHLSGEFYTASGFGLWMALNILKEQTVPACVKMNSIEREMYQTVLLYNQYRGKDHSLTLLKKC
ncbi:3-oxoacyl-ACP synthase [Flavobacterium piscinae]|uniref:3-oxoacyl-ACP synthase n=1 Tax=Flavobacterium piscinae TaxID=2506424 RepID=A0A4Q1KNW3_9FLAO|nr:beta-ketoacyl synthase N-terminal-like domain-containing protein [Flavobacterium piscinae]RXR31577.1 3-oxoacyl-ACP synthase [Flavobacterium piscinae]